MNNSIVELVKQLREQTGAGIMECKKALEETSGDLALAKKLIEKQGLTKAKEKEDRETKQGYVATYTHTNGKIGAVVEILSESDFVARNEEFRALAKEICLQVAAMAPKNEKLLLKQEYIRDPQMTVGDLVKSMIAKFGENIRISRIGRFEI